MTDRRDTNHDGKVSLMEKVKDKLHHHKDAEYTTTTTTHHTTGYNTTATGHNTTGHTVGGAVPVVGAVPVAGAVPIVGVPVVGALAGAAPIAGSTTYGSTAYGVHDSRDLNRDGHVSAGERLVAGGTHGSAYGSTHATHASTIGQTVGSTHVGEEARLRLHEEQLAISKREVGAGEVGIHKRVHEENVTHTVPVRREEVTIERRPLSGIADPHAHIAAQDETLRVALHREEVVTEKRVVPTEEIIVRKKQVTDHQQVGATLRSEHLETVQTGLHQTGLHSTNATGLHDARDTNYDGHVSVGEKLKGSHATNTTGLHDARDSNYDGHVSVGEKLKGATHR